MKSSKVIHVPTRGVRDMNRVYDLYSSKVIKIEQDYIESTYRRRSTNVSCQCNIRRDLMCTCRRLASPEPRYFSSPKHVYRYSDWRTLTDVGVGSIKALPRKRIRKIYLPETVDRAVGSVDLITYMNRKSMQQRADNYYENKTTSSKCLGGFEEIFRVPLVDKQISPIIQKKSGTTSPENEFVGDQNIMIGGNDIQKCNASMCTQANKNEVNAKPETKTKSKVGKIKSNQTSTPTLQGDISRNEQKADENVKSVVNNPETCKDDSSDSLVQHVHNLENPSDDKQSKISDDPMENKLEREYRKIFTSKSKERPRGDNPMPDFKSASLLKRRFEALRRGLGKKESKKENNLITKIPSQTSMLSRKDVSIASDPPSLEGRSYSNTKIYSPYQSTKNVYMPQEKVSHKKSPKSNKNSTAWSPELGDSKYESVQGMFKLWGKKFNLDEDNCKTSPTISNEATKNPHELSKSESPPQAEFTKKKQGRKFFIFGKKAKEKENKPYKPKKGVTAGRCEVKDGLTIKVGLANEYHVTEPTKKQEKNLDKYDNILRKPWLDKYISNTRDSKNSVHIRWNNKMYATSSSTVLELMDSVYKYTGLNLRSRSEVTSRESSNYRSYTKQRVHFMHQDIEAWMIPKMITNKHLRPSIDYRPYHDNNKCQRWFVDASKGFSQKIKLVLRSKPNSKSSEYVTINIPEGYFSHSSSDLRTQSSDEKIYKIVEYDTPELKKVKETRHMATGDTPINVRDVKVDAENNKQDEESKISEIDSRNDKKSCLLRDVAIQGSNVFVPKRCDVIGVGIITQRDIRDVRKPVLKIEDDLSDDGSEENRSVICHKKCEFAESYLQDYCRNLMPSGIDMFSWRISDSPHSENNSIASLSQGDGTKSYPNMYDNFQESTILLSSCETSSCSHCIAFEDEKKPDDSLKSKLFSKFKKKSSESPLISDKRKCPKDSLEVHRRRQFYACNDQKSKWFVDESESQSMPSLECKANSTDNKKLNKPCWRIPDEGKKRKQRNEKRVSLPGCEAMSRLVDQLSDKSLEGILTFKRSCNKKDSNSSKRAEVSPTPTCVIPQPPCKESCERDKKPPCSKKNSPPCDESLQPRKTPTPPCIIEPPSQNPPICIKPVKKPPCSACQIPPCIKSNESLELNYPISKTPSQQSGLSLTMSPAPSPKQSDACFPKKAKKQKECSPNCANQKKFANKFANTPPTPPPTVRHMPQSPDCIDSKEKVTGLHLKKMPLKKRTDSNDYCDSNCPEVIRLNSQEKFTIRMKKDTPSTEEIRESLNIKVQDEDGQTLYERIDYKQSGDMKKCLLLKDMYKDPQIQRVSTPITVQSITAQNKSQNEIGEGQSDVSVENLIEINLTLKLKQGDKGTEVNIKNAGDTEIKQNNDGKITESQKSVYFAQNRAGREPVVPENKKDVNIKIVIKNYRTDPEKLIETEMFTVQNGNNDVFNKRISEKFQTVSTGYSDIDQNAFSVHRATVDLTTSVDRHVIQSRRSECIPSNQLMNIPIKLTSSQSVLERSITKGNTIKYNNEEDISLENVKKSSTKSRRSSTTISQEEIDKFFDENGDKFSVIESKHHIIDITDGKSNESILYKNIRLHTKAQKKAMLKKLFRSSSAVKKPENKKKIKEIIHAILTSDSSGTEMTAMSNELAKELTFASFDPGYFRDTDSMKNYYELDSEEKESRHKRLNPSKDNSEFSDASEVSLDAKKQGCMCSTLANKLNISLNGRSNNCGCCCRGNISKDEEVNCDDKISDLLNKECCIDVETQSSKHVLNKLNSANLSTQNETQSVVIANTSVIIQNSITDHETSKRKPSKVYLPYLSDIRHYGMNKLNRETLIGLSDDEMLVLNSNIIQKSISTSRRKKTSKLINNKHDGADILQLNETKKAVLEIYKERIVSDEGEKIVAKLPKFHIEKEKDITNYEDILTGRRKISKRNFVMMSINR